MAFVMQSESLSAQGVNNAGLGYGDENTAVLKGIHNSVAVEFDTHKDAALSGPLALGDPNDNHVSIHSRGVGMANSADHQYALLNGTSTAINPLSGHDTAVTVESTPDYFSVHVAPLTGAVINITGPALATLMTLDQWGAGFIGARCGAPVPL